MAQAVANVQIVLDEINNKSLRDAMGRIERCNHALIIVRKRILYVQLGKNQVSTKPIASPCL
jgi:hypothetical protein